MDQDEDLFTEVPRAKKKSVERLSSQILKRMLSWKILKKERKWNVNLAFTICQQVSKTLTSILVLSRSVWTILWEMMSRFKEKYMCVLLYACILQKLVGWALGNANSNYWQIFCVRAQEVLLDLSLTGPYTAVCAGILRLSISMGKQFSTRQRLVQSLCNFCIKRIAHFRHFWPILAKMCFVF